jgi:phosphohistidine swiveling domain-containing protein
MATSKTVVSFSELDPSLESIAGGKAAALARLARRGYPVPDGFVILPAAFSGDELAPGTGEEAAARLRKMRRGKKDPSFAVRSSATAEDSARTSFAGLFESVLDLRSDAEILAAIAAVRRSRGSARVREYARSRGVDGLELAVVVQSYVRAEFAGVLFTVDPVSRSLMRMTGNGVCGAGEQLVGGDADPLSFAFERPGGTYSGPDELRPPARALYRMAERLDAEEGAPQDIEWAWAGGRLYLLQSRPITTLGDFDPATGEINATDTGDFLWSNGNTAEIQPDVMTLLTWSVYRRWGVGYSSWWSRYPVLGNIGGRSYFNISIQVAPFASFPGIGLKGAMRFIGDWWGHIPETVTVPLAPFRIGEILFRVIPLFLDGSRRAARNQRRIPGFVRETPEWCRRQREIIRRIGAGPELADHWRAVLQPYYFWATAMAGVANSNLPTQLQKELTALVGADDADALLSNLGGEADLASVGPVVGLARVARGELGREEYLEAYGHRGPHEFELARPQPAEDPRWLDDRLAEYSRAPADAEALRDRQRKRFEEARRRLLRDHPRGSRRALARLAEAARLASLREGARSEAARVMGVLRAFALRAGDLTGLDGDVFHLTIDELLAVLEGDPAVVRHLPARKATYERYCALPAYPAVISGRFDPFAWAADPARRGDVFDSHQPVAAPDPDRIRGFPGAAGTVAGIVRRIDRVEDGAQLRPGEILLTRSTNVGWTPFFPRAAAIVTDVGAPLSHAAIVARELGIPAVVGCGDATRRLRTGDRVRVDGAGGSVEKIR